jgi:flagellar assembly factor FliW
MAEITTKYFGSIEYNSDAVVRFPCGLPGFEQEQEFLVLEPPANSPVVFLQSLSRANLCFPALPVEVIAPDYSLAITGEDLESLALPADCQPFLGEGISCLAILVVTENGHIHANLLSPLVINRANRRGVQAIRIDSRYSHQHRVAEGAC